MRTLGRTSWEKIKVNEVFAWGYWAWEYIKTSDYWFIMVKLGENKMMCLTTGGLKHWGGSISVRDFSHFTELYKLRVEDQNRWREN